jgi:hypothetical protein
MEAAKAYVGFNRAKHRFDFVSSTSKDGLTWIMIH